MDSTASRTRYATDGISGGEDTENGEKLVDRGSHSDPRGGDCCGRSSVKNAWRDGPWTSLASFSATTGVAPSPLLPPCLTDRFFPSLELDGTPNFSRRRLYTSPWGVPAVRRPARKCAPRRPPAHQWRSGRWGYTSRCGDHSGP